eukprot:jgi/Chrzof1/12444/Cz06g34260.t1
MRGAAGDLRDSSLLNTGAQGTIFFEDNKASKGVSLFASCLCMSEQQGIEVTPGFTAVYPVGLCLYVFEYLVQEVYAIILLLGYHTMSYCPFLPSEALCASHRPTRSPFWSCWRPLS